VKPCQRRRVSTEPISLDLVFQLVADLPTCGLFLGQTFKSFLATVGQDYLLNLASQFGSRDGVQRYRSSCALRSCLDHDIAQRVLFMQGRACRLVIQRIAAIRYYVYTDTIPGVAAFLNNLSNVPCRLITVFNEKSGTPSLCWSSPCWCPPPSSWELDEVPG
jgi:hypothetical protein